MDGMIAKKPILPAEVLSRMKDYSHFCRKVWLGCAEIPSGETLTYGELARKIGCPGAARAVGQALAKNPFAPAVPCHRVVAAGGKPGGYSAKGGVNQKLKLLAAESASFRKNKT